MRPRRFRSSPPARETPEQAKARRKAAAARKNPPSASWWREQMAKGQAEPGEQKAEV